MFLDIIAHVKKVEEIATDWIEVTLDLLIKETTAVKKLTWCSWNRNHPVLGHQEPKNPSSKVR